MSALPPEHLDLGGHRRIPLVPAAVCAARRLEAELECRLAYSFLRQATSRAEAQGLRRMAHDRLAQVQEWSA